MPRRWRRCSRRQPCWLWARARQGRCAVTVCSRCSRRLRQDSEGLLGQEVLQDVRDRRVALIGASGGRDLLRLALTARGARSARCPRLPAGRTASGSSPCRADFSNCRRSARGAAVQCRGAAAAAPIAAGTSAWTRLASATAVVSSDRLAAVARELGFGHVVRAASANAADLLQAALRAGLSFFTHPCYERGRMGC